MCPMPKVAISYRRTDSDAITGRIFDRLVARYGSESVFRDIDNMPAGVDFRHHINKIVSQSDVVLAIVGPRWVGSSRSGQRRITQEGDPVRIEIETALSADVPVIPIFVGRARMPAVSLLPASLADFAYRNGLTVDSGEDFDHHIGRLVSAIDKLLSQSGRVGSIPHSLPAAGEAGAENAIKPRYREDRSSTGDQGDVLPPGCVLGGKYEVGRLLGRGGFGATYLAWDANLRVRIAIKEFLPRQLATRVSGGTQVHPYTSSQDTFSIGLDQFLIEARNLAQFRDNPGIISVLDFFPENGTGYMVMEYLDGSTLEQYMVAHGRLDIQVVLQLLIPVADALRACHAAGLIHRDISPDNIFLTSDGRVKLLDFGAARFAIGSQSTNLSVILKEGYAPFEQYQRNGRQGPWTDVYALTATLYRLLTGDLPVTAPDRVAGRSLPPPSEKGVKFPPGLQALLDKGLAIRPEQRYQTIDAFQSDLLGIMPKLEGEPSRRPIPSRVGILSRLRAHWRR
jgi:hypothetical protein